MGPLVFLALGACPSDDNVPVTDIPTDTTDEAPVPHSEGRPPRHSGDTQVHSGSGGCGPDPGLSLSATPVAGLLPNQLVLDVTTSEPATVVARCRAPTEPEEVHLVEDTSPQTTHQLVFGGLLPDTGYVCDVAATCPESTAPVRVAWTTGPRPPELGDLTVEVDPTLGATVGYTLANWSAWDCASPPVDQWMLLWDPRGALRWWWPITPWDKLAVEVHVHPIEPWIGWGGGVVAEGHPRFAEPTTGLAYEATMPPLGGSLFSHELRTLPDGRLLTLEDVPNTRGPLTWTGFAVRLWDPSSGTVTFELNSQELVDDGTLPVPTPGRDDPWHANALAWEETPTGPELVVSLCYQSLVFGYAVDTREVTWKLGAGRGWTVTDAAAAPLTDEALPQCTHGIEREGSRLLVYDNGRVRNQSSASEWELDPTALTARRTFYWTEPGWYENILGDVEELDGGRWLVTQARNQCGEVPTSVELVKATGEVAVRTTFPNGGIYRSELVDPCRLFSSARDCPALAERLVEVGPLLGGAR